MRARSAIRVEIGGTPSSQRSWNNFLADLQAKGLPSVIAMEYRAYIAVHGLPIEHDDRHDRLLSHLEREHEDLGPVLGGRTPGVVEVILATDAADAAQAAGQFTRAVSDSLHATGLGEIYPAAVEIEPTTADELATA